MLARQLVEEEYYEALPRQEERKVIRRSVRRRTHNDPLRVKAMAVFLTATVLTGLVLLVSSILASEVYELGHIQNEARMIEKTNETLRVENAKMKSHARIKEIAVRELGMTIPQDTYFAAEQKSQ